MSSNIDLHIVSFDVPYPADYGGLIDVYYKLLALKKINMKVALHCFHYGREEAQELKDVCSEVHYYPRKTGVLAQFSTIPYIVASRSDVLLLKRLNQDDAPILFEGIHTTFLLNHPSLASRKMAARIHNREDEYYNALYKQSKQVTDKLYYKIESKKLRYYEKKLKHANTLFTLSEKEQDYFSTWHPNSRYLPVFHPYTPHTEQSLSKLKDQAVYFGNLSVEENRAAVFFLLEVFSELNIPLKIAGLQADSDLLKAIEEVSNAEYLGELSNSDLDRLLIESRVCCLPTFQDTGIKLKWIHALHLANDILLNEQMLTDESFGSYCVKATELDDWRNAVKELMDSDTDKDKIIERKKLAATKFNNESSARLLAEWCVPVR